MTKQLQMALSVLANELAKRENNLTNDQYLELDWFLLEAFPGYYPDDQLVKEQTYDVQ